VVRDATGSPQSLLVLGGNSDIAWALVERLATDRLRRVVLAGRDVVAMRRRGEALAGNLSVEAVPYDAVVPGEHARVISTALAGGDIDVVLVAFGVLGEPYDLSESSETRALADINFTAAVTAIQQAADALHEQGHGTLVVLSSVAGQRVRPENAVYGASKAGVDGFATAMADALAGTGVDVMVVRPGFVHSKMTEGRTPTPFSTTPEEVASKIVEGLARRTRIVWVPPILRAAFAVLRVLPSPVWRRLVK
jgi:decaprenylphospho-beta-D-erythro-pentofuranosid-2-ulose 2-reductase